MIETSQSYSPYSLVRRVGAEALIMPAGAELGEPDSSAELALGTQDIISLTVNESVDICAQSLKPRSLICDVINTSRLSVINDLTGREIRAGVIIGGERVSVGSFYIDKVIFMDCGLTARIIASDVATRLARFMTGLYFNQPATLFQVVNSDTGAVSGLDFIVDSSASWAYILPEMMTEIDSARNCIVAAAQAARSASVWVDRRMKVRIACLAKNEYVSAVIPRDAVIRHKSEALNMRTDIVRVYGENSLGEMNHAVGEYVSGFVMASVHNDFMCSQELEAIAQNRLEEENFRRRLTVVTRCDPAIEVGDLVNLENGASGQESFIVAAQKIVFDGNGLTCELELAGYKE